MTFDGYVSMYFSAGIRRARRETRRDGSKHHEEERPGPSTLPLNVVQKSFVKRSSLHSLCHCRRWRQLKPTMWHDREREKQREGEHRTFYEALLERSWQRCVKNALKGHDFYLIIKFEKASIIFLFFESVNLLISISKW